MMCMSVSFPSTTLLRPVEITVALPSGFSRVKPPFRVLWALHCAMGNGEFFIDSLNASEVVEKHGIALVAPSLGNGYFINSDLEPQGDFLNEMKRSLGSTFAFSQEIEDNAVLGVSMGGFGAIRWALESCEFFGAASLSGVYDCRIPPDERLLRNKAQRVFHYAFSNQMKRMLLDSEGGTRPEANFETLFQQTKQEKLPNIFLYCGEEDYLSLAQTTAFEGVCECFHCPVSMCLEPGAHDVDYWRRAFREAVSALFSNTAKT